MLSIMGILDPPPTFPPTDGTIGVPSTLFNPDNVTPITLLPSGSTTTTVASSGMSDKIVHASANGIAGGLIILVISLVIVGLVVYVLLGPLLKHTAGLINDYETGVMWRLGSFRNNRLINPALPNGERVRKGFISRLYYRFPIATEIIRVDRRGLKIVATTKTRLEGFDMEVSAAVEAGLNQPNIFLNSVKTESYTDRNGDNNSPADLLNRAFQDYANRIFSGQLNKFLSRNIVTLQALETREEWLMTMFLDQLNVAGAERGILFRQLELTENNPADALARAMAAPKLSVMTSDGVKARIMRMFPTVRDTGQGEMAMIIDGVTSEMPGLGPSDITDKATSIWHGINAAVAGSPGQTFGGGEG